MPERRYARQPDTLALLSALAVAGVILTATAELPGSVDDVVPKWAGMIWSISVSLAAGASLVGLYLKKPLNGLLTIMVGRFVLSGAMFAYTIALVTAATTWGSAIIILLVAGIATSCALSARRAAKQIRQVSDLVKSAKPGGQA